VDEVEVEDAAVLAVVEAVEAVAADRIAPPQPQPQLQQHRLIRLRLAVVALPPP